MQINNTGLYGKEYSCFKKRPLHYYLIIFFLLPLVLISNVKAQETKKEENASEVTIMLKVEGLNNDQSVLNLENAFKECGSKILSYTIGKSNQTATLVISQKLKPVDLLELLESHGIQAGYFNDKREYFTLEKEGELTEPIIIDK